MSFFQSFGAQQQQPSNLFANTNSSSLFNNNNNNNNNSSLFGNTQSQQQPQQFQQSAFQQSAPQSTPLFTRSTKFNDLPEDIRKKFEQIDTHIQGRVQISTQLKQYNLADEPQKGADHIRQVHKELVNSINKLRVDIASMRTLRGQMDQAITDTIAATRIIDAFRSPQAGQQNVWLKNYAQFPLEFFSRVTEQLRARLQWANTTLEQIEQKLASEVNHSTVTPQLITTTLQAQHTTFVSLAAKAAALDAELGKLKETYRMLWRAHVGSARDPFREGDRGAMGEGEFGLEGLGVGAGAGNVGAGASVGSGGGNGVSVNGAGTGK